MADERGRLVNSDAGTTLLLESSANNTKIIKESNYIQVNLSKGSLPFTNSEYSVRESVKGRTRVVTVEGIKIGAQAELEAFVKVLDDWSNTVGLLNPWNYFPMIHKNNTLAANNQQDGFFSVLPESLLSEIELRTVGRVLHYSLIMVEGVSVRNFPGL